MVVVHIYCFFILLNSNSQSSGCEPRILESNLDFWKSVVEPCCQGLNLEPRRTTHGMSLNLIVSMPTQMYGFKPRCSDSNLMFGFETFVTHIRLPILARLLSYRPSPHRLFRIFLMYCTSTVYNGSMGN